jgi:hypothetical protein
MAPRLPNARVPNTRTLLPSGAARANKYIPKAENSEFSITRITPQNALNLVKKFSDKELKAQYSPAEIEHLHDLASNALQNEIIGITGRDSNGNIANFNEKSIEWVLQNESLIDRLIESKSNNAKSLGAFCNYKLDKLQTANNELFNNYLIKSNMKQNDGFLVFDKENGTVSQSTSALTNPPKNLPEATKPEANKYPLGESNKPAFLTGSRNTPPKEGVVVGPETAEPGVDIPLAEGRSAVSPSPEAIHEAMADAIAKDASKDETVTVPPEAEITEETAKGEVNTEAVTDKPKAKTETEAKAEPEAKDGALTGEKPKGFFNKIGDHFKRNWGKYLLGITGLSAASGIVDDLASDNSRMKGLFTGNDHTLDANKPSANQPRVKSLDQREDAYMPERLLRFRQNTQEPFVNNTNVTTNTGDIPVNEELPVQQQEQQSQVVSTSAPVNNATADYVRAAYNSYIPSDAGRAYQKAIYGDPLELDRIRLQQQQQKWRDFVMRSGQSPAELVQRGLMPYDALQYV